jgi:hypothetical protein
MASIARSIVGRAISCSSSSVNQRSAIPLLSSRLRRNRDHALPTDPTGGQVPDKVLYRKRNRATPLESS